MHAKVKSRLFFIIPRKKFLNLVFFSFDTLDETRFSFMSFFLRSKKIQSLFIDAVFKVFVIKILAIENKCYGSRLI
jgi:hypothetical protein